VTIAWRFLDDVEQLSLTVRMVGILLRPRGPAIFPRGGPEIFVVADIDQEWRDDHFAQTVRIPSGK
jgi:hypothetical protein